MKHSQTHRLVRKRNGGNRSAFNALSHWILSWRCFLIVCFRLPSIWYKWIDKNFARLKNSMDVQKCEIWMMKMKVLLVYYIFRRVQLYTSKSYVSRIWSMGFLECILKSAMKFLVVSVKLCIILISIVFFYHFNVLHEYKKRVHYLYYIYIYLFKK